jgi:hypothetical protein
LKTIEMIRPIHVNLHITNEQPYTEIQSSDCIIKIKGRIDDNGEPMIDIEIHEDGILRRSESICISDRCQIEINKKILTRNFIDPRMGQIFSL